MWHSTHYGLQLFFQLCRTTKIYFFFFFFLNSTFRPWNLLFTGEQNWFSVLQTIISVKSNSRQEHVARSSLPISPVFSWAWFASNLTVLHCAKEKSAGEPKQAKATRHAAVNDSLSKWHYPSVHARVTGLSTTQKSPSSRAYAKLTWENVFLPPNYHGFVSAEHQGKSIPLETEGPVGISSQVPGALVTLRPYSFSSLRHTRILFWGGTSKLIQSHCLSSPLTIMILEKQIHFWLATGSGSVTLHYFYS